MKEKPKKQTEAKKTVKTWKELEEALLEAERSGAPIETKTYLLNLELSEEQARRVYASAFESGIPMKGRPPFVQPDSPGTKKKQ